MSIILNIIYSFIYLSFLFFSIWGYGSLLKRQFKKELNFGETGRYGSYKYNNQDHSILMGILVAENLTSKKNHDLWSVNTDYEYQEKSEITETGLKINN